MALQEGNTEWKKEIAQSDRGRRGGDFFKGDAAFPAHQALHTHGEHMSVGYAVVHDVVHDVDPAQRAALGEARGECCCLTEELPYHSRGQRWSLKAPKAAAPRCQIATFTQVGTGTGDWGELRRGVAVQVPLKVGQRLCTDDSSSHHGFETSKIIVAILVIKLRCDFVNWQANAEAKPSFMPQSGNAQHHVFENLLLFVLTNLRARKCTMPLL